MESKLVLITGMPSSGKTTLAEGLGKALRRRGVFSLHVDGIEFRRIVGNYVFDERSIDELFERIEAFTEVMKDKGMILIYSLVAHRRHLRERLKRILSAVHVHLECPVEILKERDSKGVYKAADRGEMFLPGYSEPYEMPLQADLVLRSCEMEVSEEVEKVLKLLERKGWL